MRAERPGATGRASASDADDHLEPLRPGARERRPEGSPAARIASAAAAGARSFPSPATTSTAASTETSGAVTDVPTTAKG